MISAAMKANSTIGYISKKRRISVETFDDFPLQVFDALQPWISVTGMAVLHPGRGNKGLVLMDLAQAPYLLDIREAG